MAVSGGGFRNTPGLTERQRRWFASIEAGLVRDTGRTLEAWVEIARTCPETTPRARTLWLKSQHGLGQNRAAQILAAAFPEAGGWTEPDALRAALWADPAAHAILEALEARILALPEVTSGQRKSYTAFSRRVQMAAARPLRAGRVLLGLAIPPDADPRLAPRGRSESWGDRLTGQLTLSDPTEADASLDHLLARAWEAS